MTSLALLILVRFCANPEWTSRCLWLAASMRELARTSYFALDSELRGPVHCTSMACHSRSPLLYWRSTGMLTRTDEHVETSPCHMHGSEARSGDLLFHIMRRSRPKTLCACPCASGLVCRDLPWGGTRVSCPLRQSNALPLLRSWPNQNLTEPDIQWPSTAPTRPKPDPSMVNLGHHVAEGSSAAAERNLTNNVSPRSEGGTRSHVP